MWILFCTNYRISIKKNIYDLWWYISMLANTFSDTKALWKPNMVWFISLQGTNNFTNIWLYWRTSTIVTLHIKQIPISFFFFLNNTSFVGMKAVVSSSFSDDIPDKQRPTIWFFYWLGVRAFEIWTKKEKQPLGIKAKTSEIKMVWREEHKIQDQKSRRDPLNSDPLAVNSRQSTNGWLPGLPGAGKVQWWFLYFKKLGTMFWIVQYQSKN